MQYVHYLGDIATGNFGTSLFYFPSPVIAGWCADAIFWTLGLVGVATILAFVLGTGVGIVSAWRRGGLARQHRAAACSSSRRAIPYFWVGMMFILIFGIKLQWLPWTGGYDLTAHARAGTPPSSATCSSTPCCPASRC